MVHVHGFGVDPADGQLYAATHSGLFQVPPDGLAIAFPAVFEQRVSLGAGRGSVLTPSPSRR